MSGPAQGKVTPSQLVKLAHVVIQLIRYINKTYFKVLAVLKLTVQARSHVPGSLNLELRSE